MEPPPWIGNNIPTEDELQQMGNTQCCFVDLLRLFSTIDTLHVDGSTFEWRARQTNGLYWEHRELALAAASQIRPTMRIREIMSMMGEMIADEADDLQLLDVGGCLDELRSLTLLHGRICG